MPGCHAMVDIDTIAAVGSVALLGIATIGVEVLDYHSQVYRKRRDDYKAQQQGQPNREYVLSQPTWVNTLRDTMPAIVLHYGRGIRHPFTYDGSPDPDRKLRESTQRQESGSTTSIDNLA